MRHLKAISHRQERPAPASFLHALFYWAGSLLFIGGLSKIPN